MNCDSYQKLCILQLDEKLEPDQEIQLQEHLLICPVCQKEAQQLQALKYELDKINKIYPSEHILEKIRVKASQRLLKTENKTFSIVPRMLIAIPRFSYALGTIIAVFLLISFFSSTTQRFQMAQLKTKPLGVPVQNEVKGDFQKIEEYFKGIYVAKVERETRGALSMLDKSVTMALAKINSDKYVFSFSAPSENVEDAIKDLENRVKKII